jgi:hypothetical protein
MGIPEVLVRRVRPPSLIGIGLTHAMRTRSKDPGLTRARDLGTPKKAPVLTGLDAWLFEETRARQADLLVRLSEGERDLWALAV